MEMEDHHHHHHQPQQYHNISDLRQLVNGPRSTHFPSIAPPPTAAELFPGHRNLTPTGHQHHPQHYEMMNMFGRDIMPRGLNEFASADSTTAASAAAATNTVATTTSASTTPPPLISGLYAETSGCFGGDASTGRWPRQETLTLLEIRSRLDPKFKEANHKGPLWDEVSRIMSEEHAYQRSGKKCREKFENLYKYYKKTKEGKAGRQDGKHYRFFRQLEALYGENNNPASVPETNFGSSIHFQTQTNQEMFHSHHKNCDSLSLTNSTEFSTSSSDDNDHHSSGGLMENEYSMEKRRKKKSGRRWKVKIRDFIDSQMKKLIEKQEEWLDKLMKTIEQKEKERVLREEEWRKQEATRLEREHKFWAKEMAWIEARDAALMEALQKLTGREIIKTQVIHEGPMGSHEIQNHSENQNDEYGSEEILNGTAHVRGAESSWPESEITRNTAKEGKKKRKENSRSFFYLENINDQSSSLYNQESTYCDVNDQRQETRGLQRNGGCGSSPSNSNIGDANVPSESACFPFLMSEGGNLWDNYGLKLNNANQNHH